MTEIQQVLLKLEAPYAGHPYYVTGNAILHALAATGLDYREQRQLNISHGMFVPAPYGVFPDWHSQGGGRLWFGSTLKPVETYQDLYLFRRPMHRWIHDHRPADAHNVHGILSSGGRIQLADETTVQTGADPEPKHLSFPWFIQFYLHDNGAGIVPMDEDRLDGLFLGGSRNYGYGETSFKDSQIVDLDSLDYSAIESASSHVLELISPYVLTSEFPKANDRGIPGWWDNTITYRRRPEAIVQQRERYWLGTVDHGQVSRYEGNRPVDTARNGVTRIGTHSKYGFGEVMVRPA